MLRTNYLLMSLCVLLGMLGGLGGFTFYYANGASYLSNDPHACVNCHIMREQYDGWQKASHHAVATCNDCHVPHDILGKYFTKMRNGYEHSRAFTFQDFHEPIQIKPYSKDILLNNCLYCHGEFVSQIATHESFQKNEIDCVVCHPSVGHGPSR